MKIEKIAFYIDSLEKERADLEKQIHQLAWYMRGGYSREELLNLDSTQRSYMLADIETRVKTVEETKLPLL